MLSMSRGFAVFGCFFSIFECQMEKVDLLIKKSLF